MAQLLTASWKERGMGPPRGCIGLLASLIIAAPSALGEVTAFSFPLDVNSATLTYTMRVYAGNTPIGEPLLDISGSAGMDGNFAGNLYHEGSSISQIELGWLTGGITAPIYQQGYVDGLHLEVFVQDMTIICPPIPALDVGPTGDFSDASYRLGWGPETSVVAKVGDLVNYRIGFGLYPITTQAPLQGNVTMSGGATSLDFTFRATEWEYIGDDVPGLDYTIWGSAAVMISVPEPGTLCWMGLGLIAAGPVISRRWPVMVCPRRPAFAFGVLP
jgi:hypothetical protein